MIPLNLLLLPFICFLRAIRNLVVLQRRSREELQIIEPEAGMKRRMLLGGNIMIIGIIEGDKNFVLQVRIGILDRRMTV